MATMQSGSHRAGGGWRVPIGIAAIDGLLGGGVPAGIFVDVFGGHGTGKTQMLLQAAARFAGAAKRVLYVDTAGTFRPERILQMAPPGGDSSDILGMISVARVQSVAEQLEVLHKLDKDGRSGGDYDGGVGFDLVVIDSLTDLFSYEYSRYGDLRERNKSLFRYVRGLAKLAVRSRVTVMASNVVRVYGDEEVENMADEVGLFAHVRVRLFREENRSGGAGRRLCGYAYCAMPGVVGTGDQAGGPGPGYRDAGYDIGFSYKILTSGIETSDYDGGNDGNGGISLP